MPGDLTPMYRGIPYHSEEMARGAFDAACRNWGEYDIDLLDAEGNILLHHNAEKINE
jgi:hypothetical protein